MDIDRNVEPHTDERKPKTSSSETEKQPNETSKEPHFTEVENAHASGLGSMGRSDEKVKDKEKGGGSSEGVY